MTNSERERYKKRDFQDKSWDEEKEDAVDLSIGREDERGSTNGDVSESAVYLEKPEAFGKTASPLADQPELAQVDPNRSVERLSMVLVPGIKWV